MNGHGMNEQQMVELKPEFTLKRRIQLLDGLKQGPESLLADLNRMPGVESAHLNGSRLQVCYDASRLQLDQLLVLITERGCRYRQGMIDRVRLGWYRMIDRNTWDAARHVPHCCNKSPR